MASILKQIWDNRGFGKYTLYGGLKFYFLLRMQFFAYLFAGITGVVSFVGIYRTYQNYEPSYWRESVYYNPAELPIFELDADTYYTFELSDDLDWVWVNGSYFAPPKSRYLLESQYHKLPYKWNRIWHVKFPYRVRMSVLPELSMVFNDVISEKIEVSKYKQEGTLIDYRYFEESFYTPPPVKNNSKKKKK